MFTTVTFLTLLSKIPFGITANNTCTPNTHFVVNGRLCICSRTGHWTDNNCQLITRRYSCSPGHIIWHGCSQCICQENRQLLCSNVGCFEDTTAQISTTLQPNLNSIGSWCTPFKSYFINCNICVCPASGRASEARCTVDSSCSTKRMTSRSAIISVNMFCIPNVMYLFPCLQCMCSDEGLFNKDKCTETCHNQEKKECVAKTFYRKDCNVCYCPDDGIVDQNLCSSKECEENFKFFKLKELRSKKQRCVPQTFTNPVCHYCECDANETANEFFCLEVECIKTSNNKYTGLTDKCTPGEMVAKCMECFCSKSGFTNETYCSKSCTYDEKLDTLSTVIKDSSIDSDLIDLESIKTNLPDKNKCNTNSIYIDHDKYCLCPGNSDANLKLCIPQVNNIRIAAKKPSSIDFTRRCEPSTFIQFDCNTCFCSKNGTIDPNWCTNDDCLAKKVIQDAHRSNNYPSNTVVNRSCSPGSLTKLDCNFCICPENGRSVDRVCTKTECTEIGNPVINESFMCEPLAYYEVDCNICYCPRDGVQNVARCTKDNCEKNFLRSESCEPGQLFSDECNVCVCPPNGYKSGKVCTNHTCDNNPTWKKIFKISEGLLKNHISESSSRSLDLCFPGEDFAVGCDLCVCPDMGLKSYATCTPMLCEDSRINDEYPVDPVTNTVSTGGMDLVRARRHSYSPTPYPSRVNEAQVHEDGCLTYNVSDSAERKDCSPGSVYIIRCRECICPYMGNINYFCRDLPKNRFCEKAFPNFNYVPMGRRINEEKPWKTFNKTVLKHEKHTEYSCKKPGRVMDECFVCECLDSGTVIFEHCFKSDDSKCVDAKPSFLTDDYKVVLT